MPGRQFRPAHAWRPLVTVRLSGWATGRALVARLVGRERTDYAGPDELVKRASLRPPLFR